jgi:hypothetical protein
MEQCRRTNLSARSSSHAGPDIVRIIEHLNGDDIGFGRNPNMFYIAASGKFHPTSRNAGDVGTMALTILVQYRRAAIQRGIDFGVICFMNIGWVKSIPVSMTATITPSPAPFAELVSAPVATTASTGHHHLTRHYRRRSIALKDGLRWQGYL